MFVAFVLVTYQSMFLSCVYLANYKHPFVGFIF